MVDARDPGTLDLPLVFRRARGRPRKESPLTSAQRQARFRARRQSAALLLHERVQMALNFLEQGNAELARHELKELMAVTSRK
ncbi:hypothetical protein SAMN05216570_2887 [Dyella sp. OK004]|uniref:hypothetical protein n=1 Tax=Dyella sp. OK004 TaxID=1855292 RepID=UPI0008E86A93|nr:hypothetical protein [Dyella sp. OK004]SFS13541.1 hypothetical protein SAMN05216570_2887 [Dyella sp. OK004]